MRECQQNRWQRGAFVRGDHRGEAKMRECPAEQVAERGFCERQRIDGRKNGQEW